MSTRKKSTVKVTDFNDAVSVTRTRSSFQHRSSQQPQSQPHHQGDDSNDGDYPDHEAAAETLALVSNAASQSSSSSSSASNSFKYKSGFFSSIYRSISELETWQLVLLAMLLLGGLSLCIAAALGVFHSSDTDSPVVSVARGAVAADSEICSQVGVDMLNLNGSAVDAAIATLLCLGVVNAHSSGIGGGGFMVVHANGVDTVIDFREVAPAAAYPEMFKNSSTLSQIGGLSVGVPGELRGLEYAWKKFGFLEWSYLFQPAIKLARDGFVLQKPQVDAINSELPYILNDTGLSAVYAPGGVPLKVGDLCVRTNLARTLENIAEHGADAFYDGNIAQSLVAEINQNGGNMTLADFKSYQPVERTPLRASYNGFGIVSAPPPASGAVMISVLNILDGFVTAQSNAQETVRRQLRGLRLNPGPMQPRTLLDIQRTTEAFKFGYALRTRLADPFDANYTSEIEATVSEMLNLTSAATKRARVNDSATFGPDYYGAIYDMEETPGTTHLSVLGTKGDAVAVTSTINTLFGSKIMSPSTGIILNDEMDDFSSPNITNYFGVPPSPANFIKPGKRPLSSSAPTIVFNAQNEVFMIVGASGGTRITTSTIQVMQSVMTFGEGIEDSISRPRFHHQLLPNQLMVEPTFPQDLVAGMKAIGHNTTVSSSIAVVQGIVQYSAGVIHAMSDPRKGGKAVVLY